MTWFYHHSPPWRRSRPVLTESPRLPSCENAALTPTTPNPVPACHCWLSPALSPHRYRKTNTSLLYMRTVPKHWRPRKFVYNHAAKLACSWFSWLFDQSLLHVKHSSTHQRSLKLLSHALESDLNRIHLTAWIYHHNFVFACSWHYSSALEYLFDLQQWFR
jgi:hypothetical protein